MTPEERISDLEDRLDQYHEWLVEAVEQRDRLALDAAWGATTGFGQAFVIMIFLFYLHEYAGEWPWWVSVFAGLGVFVAQIAVTAWIGGLRMKEVDKMSKLPSWTRKD